MKSSTVRKLLTISCFLSHSSQSMSSDSALLAGVLLWIFYFASRRSSSLSFSINISAFLHFIPLETWQNKCSIQHFGAKYTDMAWLHRGLFRFAHIKSHRIDSCVMCTKCFCRRNEYSNKWRWSKYSVEYKQPANVNSHPMLSFSFFDTFPLCTYSLQLCATSREVDWM